MDYTKEQAKFLTECVKVVATLFLLVASAEITTFIKLFIDILEKPDITTTTTIVLLVSTIFGLMLIIFLTWWIWNKIIEISSLLETLK